MFCRAPYSGSPHLVFACPGYQRGGLLGSYLLLSENWEENVCYSIESNSHASVIEKLFMQNILCKSLPVEGSFGVYIIQ